MKATLTLDQFDAIARLIRALPGPIHDAARVVLVFGLSSAAAARELGANPHAVRQSVVRYRKARAVIGSHFRE